MSFHSRKGFTLAEVLLASTIFAVVGLIAITIFVSILRIQQRIALENAIYEDARFMMERIAREVRRNAIDYEEYYNKLVEQKPYGVSYGCYGSRFYNPGKGSGPLKGNFGALCNDGTSAQLPQNVGCVLDKETLDINTGKNPFDGNVFGDKGSEVANAFCDKNFANNADPNCGSPNQTNHHLQKQLYLINPQGTEKTILALKEITSGSQNEHALALLRLTGEDEDNDGIREQWASCSSDPQNPFCCSKDFSCPAGLPSGSGTQGPLESTLSFNPVDNYQGFVPISPTRSDVIALDFFVAPLEDPRKAFAEDSVDIQQQPHVTIMITVQPARSVLQNYTDTVPQITLQTTLTSRVYNEVKSFGNIGVCQQY